MGGKGFGTTPSKYSVLVLSNFDFLALNYTTGYYKYNLLYYFKKLFNILYVGMFGQPKMYSLFIPNMYR